MVEKTETQKTKMKPFGEIITRTAISEMGLKLWFAICLSHSLYCVTVQDEEED